MSLFDDFNSLCDRAETILDGISHKDTIEMGEEVEKWANEESKKIADMGIELVRNFHSEEFDASKAVNDFRVMVFKSLQESYQRGFHTCNELANDSSDSD